MGGLDAPNGLLLFTSRDSLKQNNTLELSVVW